MSDKTFYVTTPIYYVNARPHIGHAYTTIVADVLARRHRLLGEDTFFLTGTDEHGQKIERSAAAAGILPQQFADQVSKSFQDLWHRMGILRDTGDPLYQQDYIRTTDPRHKQGVQKLFSELYARGFIYLASYTGAYCVSDEAFVDAPIGTPCPDCGRILEEVTEENFFFKLSAFQQPLIELIKSNTIAITPESRKNEVLSFLCGDFRPLIEEYKQANSSDAPEESIEETLDDEDQDTAPAGRSELLDAIYWGIQTNRVKTVGQDLHYIPGALKDLSISRSSFTWGVPVPEPAASTAAQKHVIYVWLDALANYMTALGYGSDDETLFKKFWPADLHLVGKEIIRFHCIYWPAFLLALNPKLQHKSTEEPPTLPLEEHIKWAKDWLPKAITAHGWLLFEDSKMSKSKGNIVRTETILDAFGTLCPPPTALKGTGFSPSVSTTPKDAALAAEGNQAQPTPSSESTNRRGTASPGLQVPPVLKGAGFSPSVTTAHKNVALAAEGNQAQPTPFSESTNRRGTASPGLQVPPVLKGAGFSPSVTTAHKNVALAAEGSQAQPTPSSESTNRRGTASAVPESTSTEDGASAPEVRLASQTDRDLFSSDVLRYFLLREIPFGQDGSFSFDALITRYNADLANGYGNLVSRVANMISKYFDGSVPDGLNHRDPSLMTAEKFGPVLGDPLATFEDHLRSNRFHLALEWISQYVTGTDQVLSARTPWKLTAPEDREQLSAILYTTAEAIRIITALLYPILPYATARVWSQLGLGDIEQAARNGELTNIQWGGLKPGTKLGPLSPIFPRADKGLAKIMTDMENPTPLDTTLADPAAVPPTTDPAAAPRTSTINELTTTLPVGGSTALTTGPDPTHPAPAATEPTPAPEAPTITIDDFAKIELRVAEIKLAERIPKADKLLRLEVDLGPLGQRQILSGIAEHYAPEDLIGRRIIVITNLAPRKMRGLESHGMLLAASEENGKPFLATVPEGVPLGTRLK